MLADTQILRIPGPTPIPPSVQIAMAKPMIGHRSEETVAILKEVQPTLQQLFGTNRHVAILASSGTGAMETSMLNVVHPGEEILVVVTGAFGERFAQICETYEKKVHRLNVPWGQAACSEEIKTFLQRHPKIQAVFLTVCETSTSVLNPIEEIAKTIKENSNALVIVDGVSSIGGAAFQLDKWEVDVAVTGSQKAFMLPSGLSFLATSEKAWQKIASNPRPRFYFDLTKYHQFLTEHSTPFTPASSLLFGLQEAMRLFQKEGIENVYHRHHLMMRMIRAAMKAINLPLLAADPVASPTVTAIRPTTFHAKAFRQLLKKEFNLIVAGGQQHLKDEIIRIGHMGYCSPNDLLQVVSMIEIACQKVGHEFKIGSAVAAAQNVYVLEGNYR